MYIFDQTKFIKNMESFGSSNTVALDRREIYHNAAPHGRNNTKCMQFSKNIHLPNPDFVQ